MSQTLPPIRLLLLDVDGVLTDGSILVDTDGREVKRFHVRDGAGIVYWQKCGFKVGVITGRPSPITSLRLQELGVDLIEQCRATEKLASLEALLHRSGFRADQVAYMGDDLADLPVLNRVAYPMAVADAVSEVRAIARYTTKNPGGRGAVREVIEHLLRGLGRWDELVQQYAR